MNHLDFDVEEAIADGVADGIQQFIDRRLVGIEVPNDAKTRDKLERTIARGVCAGLERAKFNAEIDASFQIKQRPPPESINP